MNEMNDQNSLFGISKKLCLHYDIGYNSGLLATFCHVVYATLGFFLPGQNAWPKEYVKSGMSPFVPAKDGIFDQQHDYILYSQILHPFHVA